MEYHLKNLDWELTSKHSRAARSAWGAAYLHGELTLDEAQSVIAKCASLRVEKVNLIGDEPLLYPNWYQIAILLDRYNIRTELTTFSPIPENITVEKIRDSGISRVSFGLDGLAVNHDSIHKQPELFKSILRCIEKVQAVDLPVGIITMVSDQNIGDLPTLLYVIHATGAANWKLQALMTTSSLHCSNGTKLSDDTYRRLGSLLERMNPQAEKLGITLELADNLGYYGYKDINRASWRGCPGGRTSCAITSSGKVKACIYLPDEMIAGDLRQMTLSEIWNDHDSFSFMRAAQKSDLGPNCDDCDYAVDCRGGCSAMSLTHTGKLHNDPFCFQGLERRG